MKFKGAYWVYWDFEAETSRSFIPGGIEGLDLVLIVHSHDLHEIAGRASEI